MKKLILLFFVAITLLSSCSAPAETELTEEQKAAIVAEVESQLDGIQTAISQLDFDAWSEYWSKTGFISANSEIIHFDDLSVWKDSVASWWSSVEARVFELNDIKVTPLSSDLALSHKTAHLKNIFKNGEEIKVTALVTLLWKKEPEGWKIIDIHESFQPVTDEQDTEEE